MSDRVVDNSGQTIFMHAMIMMFYQSFHVYVDDMSYEYTVIYLIATYFLFTLLCFNEAIIKLKIHLKIYWIFYTFLEVVIIFIFG